MASAVVLLRIDTDAERGIIEEIRGYAGVMEANYLFGPYDMYIKIHADTEEGIHNLVLDKIRRIEGIKSTTTCFIAD
jgi:DNA-binding Lrp family transcriptional regulator